MTTTRQTFQMDAIRHGTGQVSVCPMAGLLEGALKQIPYRLETRWGGHT